MTSGRAGVRLDIPVMVYDAEYAFLVGYPDPPPGWFKMPHREPARRPLGSGSR